ncbi:MAG: S-layer homology domain-containing protein, partial [Syntrophomonadaceae bacterium]|nr:S-layer homology domain-containing protein [Syntrophomonadaceae bacterium]
GSSGGGSTSSTGRLEIPSSFVSNPNSSKTLTLGNDIASVTIPSDMLDNIPGIVSKKAEINISEGDKESLPDDVKAAIGDRPLIQLTLLLDGKKTDWSNPDAPVTVSIPYSPTAEELANPEGITAYYIDGNGNLTEMAGAKYDPQTKTVVFQITHFSYYAVGYKTATASVVPAPITPSAQTVQFRDVLPSAWYYDAVSFCAAKGITTGTGNGNFSPDATLTRGQFITMLLKAYSIEAIAAPTDNFADAGSTYYTGYLAAAKARGISNGVGDNKFAPEKAITRQEMFTLLYNALKNISQLPQGDSGKTLSEFSDANSVAAWATEAMTVLVKSGTVSGSDGKLDPTGGSTRAQMAQVLYNLLRK